MTPREEYQYALLRAVPDVERGEGINVGVVVFSRRHHFLGARTHVDHARLATLHPGFDDTALRRHLDGVVAVAAGEPDAGPIAAMPQSERFGWLTAASSTILQPSPIHTGLCGDPERLLDHLFRRLVANPPLPAPPA